MICNKTIRSLIEEATYLDEYYGDKDDDYVDYTISRFDKDLFAELIIKECLDQIDMLYIRAECCVPIGIDQYSYLLGVRDAMDDIKDRFVL